MTISISAFERSLSRRWRLSVHARQRCVNASPARRAGCPDRHRRAGKIRIIEGSDTNEDQMRSCLGLAEERRAAVRAKPAVHSIAAVCDAREVARLPCNLESRSAKAGANRSAACAQVLAVSAPAHARNDGRLHALPSNRTAQAPAGHCHRALQGQGRQCCGSYASLAGFH